MRETIEGERTLLSQDRGLLGGFAAALLRKLRADKAGLGATRAWAMAALTSYRLKDRNERDEVALRLTPHFVDEPTPDAGGAPLDTPVSSLPGVGEKIAERLESIGLKTLGDLLDHLPRAYIDRREMRTISDLRLGAEATVIATVKSSKVDRIRGNRSRVTVTISDGTGYVDCVWWNQDWRARTLTEGTEAAFSGKVKAFRGRPQMDSPAYDLLRSSGEQDAPSGAPSDRVHTGRIVPIYPATERVSATMLRRLLHNAFERLGRVPDPLPAALRVERNLLSKDVATKLVHFPDSLEQITDARRRLVFEELFVMQVGLALRKRHVEEDLRGIAQTPKGELTQAFIGSLPFRPTDAQTKAMHEIGSDMSRPRPMHRLLQGEVGSGKAQPLDASVLTPDGFKRMGDVNIGDEVVTPSGELTVVTGVFPQGARDIWELRLSDGSSVEADSEHLWVVATSGAWYRGDTPKIKSTEDVRVDLRNPNGSSKWYLPVAQPVDLESRLERPVEPYVLGLLLGDGSLRYAPLVFTSADDELVMALKAGLPDGCVVYKKKSRPYDWCIRGVRKNVRIGRNPLQDALRSLGLYGLGSKAKHVPRAYLCAPMKVRHAVLQGLLDTDGTVGRNGMNVSFLSSSPQLAQDVCWLVRSLGGIAKLLPTSKMGNDYYYVTVALPAEYPPFRLSRKRERVVLRTKYVHFRRGIREIRYAGRKPVQCISVAHRDGLYVTDGFVVTHNTLVAVHAAMVAIQSGNQAAIMAPTEVLAEQHAKKIRELCVPVDVDVELLTSAVSQAKRREITERLANGNLKLICGTHALISEDVAFDRLGLAVVDEQHRFGLAQRMLLREKGEDPDVLIMTATPIPRTMALTLYGDLDVSVLDELPAGRQPITTQIAQDAAARERAYHLIRDEVSKGRRAFVVCALVDESNSLEAKAAVAEAERLQTEVFPDLEVGLLHGQMRPAEKDDVMERFRRGDVSVLIATTVIEVGVDVPEATVMLIENAERFGLSQLHQLRGRIGRGAHGGVCILFSDAKTEEARMRLEAVANSNDGFALAEKDLEIRGEGTIFGTRQAGITDLKVARLIEDFPVVVEAREAAFQLVDADPKLLRPEHVLLRGEVARRFGDQLEWLFHG